MVYYNYSIYYDSVMFSDDKRKSNRDTCIYFTRSYFEDPSIAVSCFKKFRKFLIILSCLTAFVFPIHDSKSIWEVIVIVSSVSRKILINNNYVILYLLLYFINKIKKKLYKIKYVCDIIIWLDMRDA